jgi:hypothetical protein
VKVKRLTDVALGGSLKIRPLFTPRMIHGSRRSKLLYYWRSVSQSVCLSVEHPCGTCDQILLPVGMLLSELCGLVSVGRPLWREDESAISTEITQWSESRRTRNHTLLSHLRLPQLGGPISVRNWVNSRVIVRLEELSELKTSMVSSRIEPVTFRSEPTTLPLSLQGYHCVTERECYKWTCVTMHCFTNVCNNASWAEDGTPTELRWIEF